MVGNFQAARKAYGRHMRGICATKVIYPQGFKGHVEFAAVKLRARGLTQAKNLPQHIC